MISLGKKALWNGYYKNHKEGFGVYGQSSAYQGIFVGTK